MKNYIDGFTLPIPRKYLNEYKNVASKVAEIWKEHGALAYYEYVGDDMQLEGTRSFINVLDASDDEVVIFGWVVFESKASRDLANQKVATDPRMVDLISPLTDPSKLIFNAERMVYGGFESLV
ncbi:MAG: DUF1428 domain-containing protein [Saprospiraceae bacterium]|nr:DUF1428 domain-containing protein [Bacteroidia bacterium]NNE15671.1 DUF1428 domain-containing protein [Saprospiraceae bacterium]NNL93609.1 DUF1428 domain-containing protein [Saprospiraceae bacterium]